MTTSTSSPQWAVEAWHSAVDAYDAAFGPNDRGKADQSAATELARLCVSREEFDRYYEALVQADLKIRSFPGADQSDVEFIRQALGAGNAK
jgi:hypothetical protein